MLPFVPRSVLLIRRLRNKSSEYDDVIPYIYTTKWRHYHSHRQELNGVYPPGMSMSKF